MWSFLSLFEIPEFLSTKECEHIIGLAKVIGLHGSELHTDEELEKRKESLRGETNRQFK